MDIRSSITGHMSTLDTYVPLFLTSLRWLYNQEMLFLKDIRWKDTFNGVKKTSKAFHDLTEFMDTIAE